MLVFLCHAVDERATVNAISRRLEDRHHIGTWYAPRNCRPGQAWADAVMDGLERCDAFVAVLSRTSVTSKWVEREIHQAVKTGKLVVPVVLEGTRLSGSQDFYLDPLHQLVLENTSAAAVNQVVDAIAARLTAVEQASDDAVPTLDGEVISTGVLLSNATPPSRPRARVTQATPAYFIFLVDCSHSMSQKLGRTADSKKKLVADTINRVLYRLARESVDEDVGYQHYFDVSVIGYGLGRDGRGTESLLMADRVGIPALMDQYVDEEEVPVVRRTPEGEIASTYRQPVWIRPRSQVNGNTVMATAFRDAAKLAREWIVGHADSMAPIVMNITDGQWTGESPVDAARMLEELSTDVGNVAVINCQLGQVNLGAGLTPLRFPSALPEGADVKTKDVFELSSELSDAMLQEARDLNYPLVEGARGYVLNGDLGELVAFLDIGTRTEH